MDDNAGKDTITFRDGARLDVDATAHHVFDVANIDPEDQRHVWVPFHFIPGNEGNEYTEKLICRKNSTVVQELVDHHVRLSEKSYYLPLLGITAHVFADTFSHYGFSGVSSRKNRVDMETFQIVNGDKFDDGLHRHIKEKEERFRHRYGREGGFLPNIKRLWQSLKSEVAETASGALGHGAALTYPDRPYMHWQFEYEDRAGVGRGGIQDRNNPETFLEGAPRVACNVPCLSALRIHPLGVDCVPKMASGSILHVVCVCINRIGTQCSGRSGNSAMWMGPTTVGNGR